MVESALVLGVFGMFGFWMWVASQPRLKRLEERLATLEARAELTQTQP